MMKEEPPTHSESPAKQTDNSDKTESVSNQEFLQAVFGHPEPGRAPLVVSFTGSPAKPPTGAWGGFPWTGTTKLEDVVSDDANNYFSLAEFVPDKDGRFRRKKSQFQRLGALMLDDVGTKVPIDRIDLPPSWRLETSPGNYQFGYLLKEPILDAGVADRLMNAVIAAELSDPGSSGPCARLARLPVGCNGKSDPPFRCRLTHWDPTTRYTMDELVNGLELDVATGLSQRVPLAHDRSNHVFDDGVVHIESSGANIVLSTLKSKGLYKSELDDAKHDITCPWVHEHTDQVDGGTAYFEPSKNRPIGGFKCMHGHCTGRHIRDLLGHLEIDADAASMKSTIRVIPGQINEVIEAAERELAKSGRFFQRGGSIVSVFTDPTTKSKRGLSTTVASNGSLSRACVHLLSRWTPCQRTIQSHLQSVLSHCPRA